MTTKAYVKIETVDGTPDGYLFITADGYPDGIKEMFAPFMDPADRTVRDFQIIDFYEAMEKAYIEARPRWITLNVPKSSVPFRVEFDEATARLNMDAVSYLYTFNLPTGILRHGILGAAL